MKWGGVKTPPLYKRLNIYVITSYGGSTHVYYIIKNVYTAF